MGQIVQPEFQPWGKTPRWSGIACTITEKIDGTNALVNVTDDGRVLAGSRNRWLSPGKMTDNYGFAAWVAAHADELRGLGAGLHYGEWWGCGIGRGYGMVNNQKIINGEAVELQGTGHYRVFSLFDVRRFGAHNPNTPKCCEVVPKLYEGLLDFETARIILDRLRAEGSTAAPGFMRVEGVIINVHQTGQRFKLLAEKHDESKWVRGEASPCQQ